MKAMNQSRAMNPGPAGKSTSGLARKMQAKSLSPINSRPGPAPRGLAKGNSVTRGTPSNSGRLAAKMTSPRNPK